MKGTNSEIASVIFEMCIVREPTTTPGPLLLLARDTGTSVPSSYANNTTSVRSMKPIVFGLHRPISSVINRSIDTARLS